MPSTDSTQDSARGALSFHDLLKQLGEEHDRELAEVKEVVKENSIRPNNLWEERLARHTGFRNSTVSVNHSLSRVSTERRTHETRTHFMCEADSMVKIQSEALQTRSCKGFLDSQKDQISMHKEWEISEEQMKISKSFSFTNTWPRISILDEMMRNGLTHTASMQASIRSGVDHVNNCRCSVVRNPGSLKQLAWDFAGILAILFDLVWIPIQLGFDPDYLGYIRDIEWVMRIFWTADIVACCTLAYQTTDGTLERRIHKIMKNYMSSRKFLIDAVVVGGDWIPVIESIVTSADSVEGSFGLLRIGKIPRTLRILRVLRLTRIVKIEEFLLAVRDNLLVSCESISQMISMIENMLFMLLCCHVTTCIWYYISTGPNDNHWAYYNELTGPDVPLTVKYVWSFQYVATQWTPSAMDAPPRNTSERQFTVFLMMAGVMFYSTFMGAITASISTLRNLGVHDFSQFYMLRRYLYENGVSRSLTTRISRYTDLALEMHRKRIDREKVQYLKLLSGPLHIELQKEIYLPHLRIHPFFCDYNIWDPAAMSHLCFVALARSCVAKGDTVFSLGAEATRMYCAVAGTLIYQRRRGLRIPNKESRPARMVRVGPQVWCCESALWVHWYHFGSMSALIECEVVEVDANKFREVTSSRGSVFSRSVGYAKNYLKDMWDEHGFAWDVPSELIYPDPQANNVSQPPVLWWHKEIVEAETEEARMWASLDDSASESEEGRRDDADDLDDPTSSRRLEDRRSFLSTLTSEDSEDCYAL